MTLQDEDSMAMANSQGMSEGHNMKPERKRRRRRRKCKSKDKSKCKRKRKAKWEDVSDLMLNPMKSDIDLANDPMRVKYLKVINLCWMIKYHTF